MKNSSLKFRDWKFWVFGAVPFAICVVLIIVGIVFRADLNFKNVFIGFSCCVFVILLPSTPRFMKACF